MFNGLGQAKSLRYGLAVLAIGALAACDPVPQGDTSCENPRACAFVSFAAKALKADVGKNFGGGVVLRNTYAVGQVLVIDTSLPLTKAQFSQPVGQQVLGTFAQAFAAGFCSEREAQSFFDEGGQVRVRGFSKDNALVADKIIRSCRGL